MGVVDNEVRAVSKLVPIPLKDLHIQYVYGVTPIALWNHDMSLATSPHVELLNAIKDVGLDWKALEATRYVGERRLRRLHGAKKWTDEYIKKHIARRWETYRSLKKLGYRPEMYKFKNGVSVPVRVLKEPIWTTRFGYKQDWLKGCEIFDGAGRCSAAYVLGWETIPAIWVEDRRPGTKEKGGFGEKLARYGDVWGWLDGKD